MTARLGGRLESIVDFSSHLVEHLLRFPDVHLNPVPDVTPYINVLPLPASEIPKSQKVILRENATKVWNHCAVALGCGEMEMEASAKLRAFAQLVLASLLSQSSRGSANVTRLLKNIVVAGKACLTANLLTTADKVLQTETGVGTWLNRSKEMNGSLTIDACFVVEYYCLRALLDWKRGRSDLTDHWYKSILDLDLESQVAGVEKALDLFYELGRECFSQIHEQGSDNAIKWFERALSMMEYTGYTQNCGDSDLRLNIMHGLVRALKKSENPTYKKKSQELLDEINAKYGSKFPVLLLNLEVSCTRLDAEVNTDQFSSQLQEIILTVHLIEANHRLIMHYSRQLGSHNRLLASSCLKIYILKRLAPTDPSEWYERAVVCYVTMVPDCGDKSSATFLSELEHDLSSFFEASKSTISACAAQAAHVFIWTKIREADNGKLRSRAILWCQIGLHRIFESAGESSNGKLERQLISYHLLVSNVGYAYQMLERMSFMQRNNRSSRYLAYCVALRSDNETDAQSCLNTIANGQGENDQLLLACVGESIKHGSPSNTARLLQRVLEKHLQNPLLGVNLESLLQYIVKMLLQIIAGWKPGQSPDQEILIRLCSAFKHARRLRDEHMPRSTSDTPKNIKSQWFERCGFDLARKFVSLWPKRCTIDLLEYSARLCESTVGTGLTAECIERHRESMFIRIMLYASEARNITTSFSVEDLPESAYDNRSKPRQSECRLVLYRNVFEGFTKFKEHCSNRNFEDKQTAKRNQSQMFATIPLAFEALLFMNTHAYASGDTAFDEVSPRQFLSSLSELEVPAANSALLADVLLAFAHGIGGDDNLTGMRIPSQVAARLLGVIIQTLRQGQTYNIEQAARWIRCVAQLVLEDIEQSLLKAPKTRKSTKVDQNTMMLDSIMQQAITLANPTQMESSDNDVDMDREQSGSMINSTSKKYPAEELQWLATKLWNMAIDYYGAGQDETAKTWAGKALQLAEMVTDENGNVTGLIEQLRTNMRSLGWDPDQ